MGRKPADKVGLMVRLSEALRRKIEKAAQANNQSMNLEIVKRLEESFRRDDTRAERLEERREMVSLLNGFIQDFSAKWMNLTEAERAERDRRADEAVTRRLLQEEDLTEAHRAELERRLQELEKGSKK